MAPFLLLVTPFAIFLQHQRYAFSNLEVLFAIAALAAVAWLLGALAARSQAAEVIVLAGLLTLFADIQLDEPGEKRLLVGFVALGIVVWLLRQHAARIVSLMMATVLALSLLPRGSTAGPSLGGYAPPSATRGDLPLILHLVLDEYIGPEGLPADLTPPAVARQLEGFFVQREFRLFGRAYSEYASTLWSLGQLLNLAPNRYTPEFTGPGASGGTFRLLRSAYFDRLVEQGYAIRVYRPEYLDMCTGAVRSSACHTYRANSLEPLDTLSVPARQKLAVVAGAYLSRSELHMRAKRVYRAVRARMLQARVPLPAWDWERSTSAPLGTMPLFERIAEDVSRAEGGEVFFAHLLMPHYPYVYGPRCEPRPPSHWLTRSDASDAGVPGGITNRPQSRAQRYARYLDQVLCAQRQIERVLDAVPSPLRRDTIVIIQGDHGSRISLMEAATAVETSLGPSDYADHFSTLFAVRAPGVEAGYDARLAPITCLLRSLAHSNFRSVAGLEACSTSHVVHLSDGRAPQPRPLPEFWNHRQAFAAPARADARADR